MTCPMSKNLLPSIMLVLEFDIRPVSRRRDMPHSQLDRLKIANLGHPPS